MHGTPSLRLLRVAVPALWLLGGCASTALQPPEPAAALDPLHQFLDTASADSVLESVNTPWGSGITLQVAPPYFAASGRECRDLLIHDGSITRPGLTCRNSSGHWEAVRPIARHAGNPS